MTPADTTPAAPPNTPPGALHTTALSLTQPLPSHAVNPTRAPALDPLTPIPPHPTTLTLNPPLLATLLTPAELTLGAL